MHLARLENTSRSESGRGGYSLANLTKECLSDTGLVKTPMSERFSRPNVKKDGTEGKTKILPTPCELQRDFRTRRDFIDYAVTDAAATWHLRNVLKERLETMEAANGRSLWDFMFVTCGLLLFA
eukprot:GABV01002093.1.p1 GENE.GABV01002093.1~~GABV01002093.1.p1  ORF type:complete len:124 (+),score=21.75 GABV01002093.1:213-584(+)